ncbi:MAG TPA: zinc ribbon domain-containing protein [Thermoplasmata archaeon]|nr:zinc ribbon domain-containing protein [Thermoplasmata archaeon]
MELTPRKLLEYFTKFRKTVYFRILYLGVLGVIVAELFPIIFGNAATACLGLLLMPAAVFVVPYYFGERRMKNFAINALPVFVIAVLLISFFQAQATVAPNRFDLTSGYAPNDPGLPVLTLWNGTVDPVRAPPPANFNFTVRLKILPANVTGVTVYLNLTAVSGLSSDQVSYPMSAFNATSTETWYTVSRTLSPGLYVFGFWANDTGGNVTRTFLAFGPITGGFFDYYALWAPFSAIDLAIPFSFYFVILFMYWYTGRMRKSRERMIGRAAERKAEKDEEEKEEEKPKPASGGKAAKVTAFTCTNCGADVEDTDEKCPKCGAVFED